MPFLTSDSNYSLANKNVLLGISGGIAAYKCAELVRALKLCGASVRVVMTAAATEFVTPLTLQALSGNPVHTSLLDPEAEAGMGHIELARWADLLLIAPATANTLARLAQGEAGDLLTTLVLAARCPLLVAPAMNQAMWANPATQANVNRLMERGAKIAGPGIGEQACGDVGEGRMLEPGEIVEIAARMFVQGTLAGVKIVVTAGPTREPLDPVRYLSNRSSGKMGYALAQACVEAGAITTLVSGPVNLSPPEKLQCVAVETAQQMHDRVLEVAAGADIVIAAAAVADYRPRDVAADKIKKTGDDSLQLELVKNPDIIAAVAALPGNRLVVGFAAETRDLERYARDKLERKGLDAIIANDVSAPGIGFDSDSNAATLYARDGSVVQFDQRSKSQLARDVVAWLGRSRGR